MSSELHYHNIPDVKLKTVGTSIVDICAKFKTKELPVVSLIPAKLWLLPHSSFYNANFFFFSLSQIDSQDHNHAAARRPMLFLCGLALPAVTPGRGCWLIPEGLLSLASLLFGTARNVQCLEEVISAVPGIVFIPCFAQYRKDITKS